MSSNDIDNRMSKKFFKRTLLFAGSWAVVLVFGVLFCSGCLWLVALLSDNASGSLVTTPAESARYLVNYGFLSVVSLVIVLLLVRKLARLQFFKYASWALFVGIGLNTLVLIGSLIWLVGLSPQTSAVTCTSLGQQLAVANGAIAPIATELGTATAFAIDANGTYLTAYHVISGAKQISLNLLGGSKPLTVQSIAPEYDIALLKSGEATPSHLKLTSTYTQADPVYAFGYPGNTFTAGGPSVSSGLISRVLTNEELKLTDATIPGGFEIVQTDAAVNPGNSGGPLINKCGVVGVISAMSDRNRLGDYGFVSEQGISYAIGASTVANRFSLEILK